MNSKIFKKHFLGLILLSWVIPPVFGLSFLLYIEMFSLKQMSGILLSPIEPTFIVVALGGAIWFFNKWAESIYQYLDDPTSIEPGIILARFQNFPILYWSIFLLYLVIAPFTVIYSAELFTDFVATPIDWFRINLVSLIVSIIVGLPIFFMILDLFGKVVKDMSLLKPHVTIKVKVFLIGALVPLLIDTMIVQYYWTRTGYFTTETFVVWLFLEFLAITGSLIFVKSFGQSLKPLSSVIEMKAELPKKTSQSMRPLSTDELGVLTLHYKELLNHLYEYQEQLEEKVEQRTHELKSSYQELETFTYSVSHDLRAPLRAIKGFSQILLNDYDTALGETGSSYLSRICSNIDNMSVLIEQLLTLSRISNTELTFSEINLSEIASRQAELMQEQYSNKNVSVEIYGEYTVVGDENLLEILLNNLFSNAWKYSSKTENPSVEFGYSDADAAYYIKDNGVGFDINFSEKIFQPFQRLHSSDDFEGFGIGLATVQRIINRHGGSIWAEAQENKGATFYFRLDTCFN